MEASALVSVVVLCYNHASYVVECLNSVLAQRYKNWELIIADDASKDHSVAVIQDWLTQQSVGNKIRTNFHDLNTGIGTMLNQCIELAEGRYIKFISADDILAEDLLTEAVGFFEHNEKDFGVVFSNAQYLRADSSKEEKFLIPPFKNVPTGWIRKDLQFSNFIPAPAVVIKKEVFDTIGPYDPKILIDDFDCWLRASVYYRFHFINKPLVYYRIHGNNISHSIDFTNDMLALLILRDRQGDLSEGINKRVKDLYYQGKTQLEVINDYQQYTYRDKWMTFCIKNKLPYKFFRLLEQLLFKN